ncbi:hypothetical protein [Ferroplasma sp. Type II]|jgi:putative transposase|uniref:hypothetical protein n=1 Tax=Ferroplasma sp. Type II TaxID=261388 RepID=UPI0018100E88|nr:hypothetical protein [Ferroplasma sp. Type II]HIH61002.1 transposase [Ferroplasma sp.]
MGKRNNQNFVQIPFNTMIHADLNAAYNIIKKAIPEAFANRIGGRAIPPKFRHQADDNMATPIVI